MPSPRPAHTLQPAESAPKSARLKPVAIYRAPWLRALGWPPRRGTAAPLNACLPPRALLVWRERPDLQAAFDLSRPAGRAGLFWWCLLNGFGEMGFAWEQELDAGFGAANQPVPGLPQADFIPVTWLMRALWAQSGQRRGTMRGAAEQADCISHYFTHALLRANLGALLSHEQAALLRADDPALGVPRLFGLIWRSDPALTTRFPSPAAPEFAAWLRQEGARRWPMLAHPLVALVPPPRRRFRGGPVRGVNLFGHALGRLGIGEDVRMAARSLEAAGIPYVIRNVDAVAAGSEEDAAGLKLSDTSPYDVNLFCMTGMSTQETCLRLGMDLHDGRHSIGLWPWELPEWPRLWQSAWTCIDEVWATSQFTYAAYARAARVPVLHMPMAVALDTPAAAAGRAHRAAFGLPEYPFLFGFSFDGLSSFARKNPLAVVAAFRQAFPPEDRRVGLVLKGLRTQGTPQWQALLDAMEGDTRIHAITRSLPRGELLDLYRCFDAFVSLHRSEGFGRNIAEVMLLGKPVIVAAHSGNLDFTRHDTAALVPVRLRVVEPGEYPFGSGQLWGEPDVDGAAAAMKRVFEDGPWAAQLAAAGQRRIARDYSPAAVGAAWAARLRQLG